MGKQALGFLLWDIARNWDISFRTIWEEIVIGNCFEKWLTLSKSSLAGDWMNRLSCLFRNKTVTSRCRHTYTTLEAR